MIYIYGIITGLLIFDIILNINKIYQNYKYNKFIENSIKNYKNKYSNFKIDIPFREELMNK